MVRLKTLGSIGWLLVSVFSVGLTARSQTPLDAFCDTVNKVFEGNKEAIVRVKAIQGDGEVLTYGTGFYIDNHGTILTAAAILGPSKTVKVETNGLSLPAQILSRDNRSGVVLLKVFNGATPYLHMGDSTELRTASPVIGLGFPLNLPIAPIYGMITGFDSQYLDRYFCTTHLRTSMAISPGQIGGPVLNTRGDLVGMIVMAADERKFTYALPIKAIQKALTDIAMRGEVKHGWVGVGVTEVDPDRGGVRTTSVPLKDEPARVRISQIFDHTAAAASGLQLGDVVLRIGSREIHRPTDVIDASYFASVGEKMVVTVEREGKIQDYTFIVGERPTAMPNVLNIQKLDRGSTLQNLPDVETSRSEPSAVPVSAATDLSK